MKSTQKNIFLENEGNAWFERNRIIDEKLKASIENDPVLKIIARTGLKPKRVLEIGASNGWRLAALKQQIPGIACTGIEPSEKAVAAAFPGIDMRQGTADNLPFEPGTFDMVIFGFCLYLCDRADLFRIAAEADRVLADGGCLIIYDFYPDTTYRNVYTHADNVHSYKMDHADMFAWNPAYSVIDQITMPHPGTGEDTPDNRVSVAVLQKKMAEGWPDNPHKI